MNIPIHFFYVSKNNVVCISLGKTVRIEIKTHASPEQCIIIHHFWELCFLTPFRSLQNHRVVCKRYHHRVVDRKNCPPCPLISYAHCFVQGIKVACEISTSIWQKKKIANRFEQFWVEICLKNFVCKIQNPGQITRPSIDLKVVLKRKSDKDFKKVGPICGYLSFKSQLTKVCAVLSWNYPQRRPLLTIFFCQIDVEISQATLISFTKQCAMSLWTSQFLRALLPDSISLQCN